MLSKLLAIVASIAVSVPALAADFNVVGKEITVRGPIIERDGLMFKMIASPMKGKMTVIFESEGGAVSSAILIGGEIRDRKWATVVHSDKRCASACAFAWLGGYPRTMDRDARVGFHGAYLIEKGTPVVSSSANALLGAYLYAMGVKPMAIIFMTEAQPYAMNWLTIDEAARLEIDVEKIDKPWERQWAKPDVPDTLDRLLSPVQQ